MIVSSNAFVFSTCLLVLVSRYGITTTIRVIYFSLFLYSSDIIYFQNSYYSLNTSLQCDKIIIKVVFMLDLAHRLIL
jgi:hypothetical protein